MNEAQIAERLGVWNQRALRVLEQISAFRESHELLDAVIREIYPIGCRIRVDMGGTKMVATVVQYVVPLDDGLVVSVCPKDFDRCPDYAKLKGQDNADDPRIIRPWGCIDGPVYEESYS